MADAENPEVSQLWACLANALNDQFVRSATENGVERWESILSIVPKGTESPEERKFRILTRINEQLPYTWRMLCQQLETLCGEEGYSVELDKGTCTLTVEIALTAKSNFWDVDAMLRRVVPANLVIDLSLKYNQHATLAAFTHEQLSRYTHLDLREEVIR